MPTTAQPRLFATLAAATAITLGAQAVVANPVAHSAPVAAAPVSHSVELTALAQDASLMDQFGELTGLSGFLNIVDNPDLPFFPFAIMTELALELLFVLPLTAIVGVPLTLLTGGSDALSEAISQFNAVGAGISATFTGLQDWYATHNAFTGALLDPAPSDTGDSAGSGAAALLSGLDPESSGINLDLAGVDPGVPPEVPGFDVDSGDLAAAL
ncbi:hypothetical protein KIH27_05950 [Mycobacterium sp. M1]|uniref:PE domain-containing protein n=1 Tax=Mycolicibacter acidiphilus TaxID=2835306 RepID=A0ABS5RFS5_9MYCO|nr:hypothetical protein [Mycolicibacter acidiphilus]MBS9533132.1 hypothetical protein [Mycolicibacter acidiphilus]